MPVDVASPDRDQRVATRGRGQFRMSLLIPWTLVFALTASNGAILLSQRVNEAAFEALSKIAGVAGEQRKRRLLARSPAASRKRAVEQATSELRASNADLRTQHARLRLEAEKLQAARAQLQSDNERLRKIGAQRAEKVAQFSASGSRRLAVRGTRRLATLPGRVIPYVGVPAVLGATTYELIEDCELAQEMAELAREHGSTVESDPVCELVNQVPSPRSVWEQAKSEASGAFRYLYDLLERVTGLSF